MEHKPILLDQLLLGTHQAYILLFLVFVGVAISYMFSISKNFDGTKPVLKKLVPSFSDHAITRIDMILVLIFGPVVAIIFLNPSSYVEAVTSGVGWVGALNTFSGAGQ